MTGDAADVVDVGVAADVVEVVTVWYVSCRACLHYSAGIIYLVLIQSHPDAPKASVETPCCVLNEQALEVLPQHKVACFRWKSVNGESRRQVWGERSCKR